MAIYKRGREFELGTTEHKSSKWPERDSNPGPPDCESDALTTRPRCLHVLFGHVMNESTVADEFECHQTCLRNNSCKSFNVRPGADITKRLCELNNKTRKMTTESFKNMKGSSYYGPVKVSSTD